MSEMALAAYRKRGSCGKGRKERHFRCCFCEREGRGLELVPGRRFLRSFSYLGSWVFGACALFVGWTVCVFQLFGEVAIGVACEPRPRDRMTERTID